MRRLWVGTAIVVGVLAGTSGARPFESELAQAEACEPEGRVANLNFTLKDMNGADVTLSDYEGKVVLLDFWATWCPPCKIEIPGFVELYDRYQSEGFVVLGVSVDDPIDKLAAFAEEFNMNYPVLVGDGRDDIKEAFGPLYGFPTTFVIGRDGKICAEHTGFVPKEQFETEIRALL